MAFEERYHCEELDYLRQLGKLLAQEKPHLTHSLAEKEGDPDVEHLMEVFASTPNNLRQKLEDESPEFTHGPIRMLWANYLRPVPVMTVIAHEPKTDQLKVFAQVCRNELIRSRSEKSFLAVQEVLPDSHDKIVSSVACHFALVHDIWLQPLRIFGTRNVSNLKEGIIDISFTADDNVSPAMLDLNKITLWLGNEDDYTRHQLYLWFCEYLIDAELTVREYRLSLPDLWLEVTGSDNRDVLLPWPKNVHSGYHVFQEYFCCPEAFSSFHLRDAAPLPDDLLINVFTLHLYFNRPLPADTKLCQDPLRLHCTPATNLFTHHAEPVRPDRRMTEHPLRISYKHPDAYDIFQVSTITSKVKVLGTEISPSSQTRVWPELESSQYQMEYSRQREVVYWHHRTKASLLHYGLRHSIAFVHVDDSIPGSSRFNDDVITTSLICTNRMIPARLHTGDICVAVSKNPAVTSFRNVTCPTLPLWPVTDGDMRWLLISAMNLSYLSLLDRKTPIQILRTSDLPGAHHPQWVRLSRQKLSVIEKLETKPVDKLSKGVPVRRLAATL